MVEYRKVPAEAGFWDNLKDTHSTGRKFVCGQNRNTALPRPALRGHSINFSLSGACKIRRLLQVLLGRYACLVSVTG